VRAGGTVVVWRRGVRRDVRRRARARELMELESNRCLAPPHLLHLHPAFLSLFGRTHTHGWCVRSPAPAPPDRRDATRQPNTRPSIYACAHDLPRPAGGQNCSCSRGHRGVIIGNLSRSPGVVDLLPYDGTYAHARCSARLSVSTMYTCGLQQNERVHVYEHGGIIVHDYS
jgi:hypothetical protein